MSLFGEERKPTFIAKEELTEPIKMEAEEAPIEAKKVNTKKGLNFRSMPNDGDNIIKVLEDGTDVIIEGESGDYYHVLVGDELGYVAKKFIS